MMIILNYEYSREEREEREKPGPMNLSHTDLPNLTKHASFHSRVPSGAQTLGEADKRGRSDAPSVRLPLAPSGGEHVS